MKGDISADYWDMIKSVQPRKKATERERETEEPKTKRNNKYTRKPSTKSGNEHPVVDEQDRYNAIFKW